MNSEKSCLAQGTSKTNKQTKTNKIKETLRFASAVLRTSLAMVKQNK
jgi:hypothetical protein